MTVFCGIDWAESHHDVAIINAAGDLVAKKRIPDDPEGFAELIEMHADAGDNTDAPVPVAIETAVEEGVLEGTHTGPLSTPDGNVEATGRRVSSPFAGIDHRLSRIAAQRLRHRCDRQRRRRQRLHLSRVHTLDGPSA